jgi:archaemetzincin
MEIMKRIFIVSIGSVDPDILRNIANALEKAFHCKVELGKKMLIPQDSYNSKRRQYHSTIILQKIQAVKPKSFDRMLGITDVDIYVPELNFVFGEADILSGVTVISLTRLSGLVRKFGDVLFMVKRISLEHLPMAVAFR